MKPMAQKDNCSLFTQADNEVLMASDIKRSSGLLSDAAQRRHEGKQRRGFHLEETTAEKDNFSSVPSLPAELTRFHSDSEDAVASRLENTEGVTALV